MSRNPIAKALSETLQIHGITHTELHKLTGISRPRISEYLNLESDKDINTTTLWRIIQALPKAAVRDFVAHAFGSQEDLPALLYKTAYLLEKSQLTTGNLFVLLAEKGLDSESPPVK